MRNAFGTGFTSKLIENSDWRCESRHFRQMLAMHREKAVIHVDAADRSICLRPASGGRMGDSNEPEFFMGNFYGPVIRWKLQMKDLTGPLLQATCPITQKPQDLSLGAFIDDLIKIMIVPDGSYRQALTLDLIDNNTLNDELEHDGYAQNVAKQDTIIKLTTTQATKQAEQHISGNAVTNLIHLGGYVNVGGSNARE
eukprot:9500270-Pyramimonas_sp.AAC.1